MNLEINKELVISSCHVEEWESKLTEERNYSSDQCSIRLYVDGMLDTFEEEFPTSDNLKKCLELAKSLDCKWLVLDCDGLEVEFLEKFDW